MPCNQCTDPNRCDSLGLCQALTHASSSVPLCGGAVAMRLLSHDDYDALIAARDERDRLHALINSPQTGEFLDAVRAEKAHQVERWGHAHDRSKSAEHWFWLVGYLAGKALRAAIHGDKFKAKHHCVSSAAALANWYEAVTADTTGCGQGEDEDLAAKDGTHG